MFMREALVPFIISVKVRHNYWSSLLAWQKAKFDTDLFKTNIEQVLSVHFNGHPFKP